MAPRAEGGATNVVRGFVDAAWRRHDWEQAREFLAPTVEWDISDENFVDAGVYHGPEAVERFERGWVGQWADYELTIESMGEERPGEVVTVMRERGRGRSSGVRVSHRWTLRWWVRDGRIVRGRFG